MAVAMCAYPFLASQYLKSGPVNLKVYTRAFDGCPIQDRFTKPLQRHRRSPLQTSWPGVADQQSSAVKRAEPRSPSVHLYHITLLHVYFKHKRSVQQYLILHMIVVSTAEYIREKFVIRNGSIVSIISVAERWEPIGFLGRLLGYLQPGYISHYHPGHVYFSQPGRRFTSDHTLHLWYMRYPK